MRQVKAKFKVSIELGCGTGVYSLLLKKMRIVDLTVLVDTSLSALKVAQNIFDVFKEKAFLVLADATNLPFADKSFDFSLSGGLIEHFKGKQLRQIISEHCRVASNVACQFPAPLPFYWLQRHIISALNFGWPFGYELPLTCDMVKSYFQRENFQLEASSYHDMTSVLLTRLTLPFSFLTLPKQKGLLNKITATESVMFFVQSAI
jgi:ubiquinone/menaquinone biosynthesis C-methylase UbiE